MESLYEELINSDKFKYYILFYIYISTLRSIMNDSQYNLVNHFFPFMTFSLLPIHDPIFLSLLAHLIIIKRLPIQFCAFFVLLPELLLTNFIHIFTNHWLYFLF
jgi:hypothetical protein